MHSSGLYGRRLLEFQYAHGLHRGEISRSTPDPDRRVDVEIVSRDEMLSLARVVRVLEGESRRRSRYQLLRRWFAFLAICAGLWFLVLFAGLLVGEQFAHGAAPADSGTLTVVAPHSITLQGPNGPVTLQEREMTVCVSRLRQASAWRPWYHFLPDSLWPIAWKTVREQAVHYRYDTRCRRFAPGQRYTFADLPAGAYRLSVCDLPNWNCRESDGWRSVQ